MSNKGGRKPIDVTGEVVGRLTAMRSIGKRGPGGTAIRWVWSCACGGEYEGAPSVVRARGEKASCGCLVPLLRKAMRLPEQTEKTCTRCNHLKPADDFHRKSGRLSHLCRLCNNIYQQEMRVKHIEKHRARDKARGTRWTDDERRKYRVPPDVGWARYVKCKFGVTTDVVEQMYSVQQGACAICRKHRRTTRTKRMCIDHCHATGRVRGWLCFTCNVGIGSFQDNKGLLASAINYLGAFE